MMNITLTPRKLYGIDLSEKAEHFLEQHLIPALENKHEVTVDLAYSYASSYFLRTVFYEAALFCIHFEINIRNLKVSSPDESYLIEVQEYIDEARQLKTNNKDCFT